MPKLLFCSFHSYADTTSGAAIATRDLLELLARKGWQCGALCGPQVDADPPAPLGRRLYDAGIPFEVRHGSFADLPFMLTNYIQGQVPITIFRPQKNKPEMIQGRPEGEVFLNLFEGVCERMKPNLILTYGGHWLHEALRERARRRKIPIVFALHNHAYGSSSQLRAYDGVFVPSRFTQDYYRRFGTDTTVLPCPWDWSRVQPDSFERKYVTFVNPIPAKGLHVFARIAHELHKRRPDIPVLVVESRGKAEQNLNALNIDLSGVKSLHYMKTTAQPRDYYRETKLLLVPSLWNESLGRVAAEAMSNGIPVLASNRGALPETLAGAGMVFEIPARCTQDSKEIPTAEEVASWIDAIARYWDDADFYAKESELCREVSQAWHPDAIFEKFDSFFRKMIGKSSTQ